MNKSYIAMPPNDLRQLQLIQLEMLLEIDRICKKHQIKYCIIAGTTLGAVRHKGYIPWDDDADVAMLRPEYERFCKICEEELDGSRFYLQNHRNTPGYRWGYGKIRRKGTEFVRKGQEHMPYPTGIFVDLFPLDHVPDSPFFRKIHNAACTVVRKMLWSAAGAKSEQQPIKRFVYHILSLIPRDFIFKLYDVLVRFSNRRPTSMVRKLTFPTPKNGYYGYFLKWYVELAEMEFEGHLFPAAQDYDGYLRFKFGDYHKLPPLDKRQGHAYSSYKLIPVSIGDPKQRG